MISKTKIFVFLFCGFMSCLVMTGCLDGNDSETVITNWQNATITNFSLEDNSDVCESLSDYKFTIDNYGISDIALSSTVKNAGIIFNPDSLPVGTVPDSVTVEITCQNASSVIINQYDDAGVLKKSTNYKDTQYVFFNDYAVTRIDVTSYDGQFNKSYFLKVNVHKVYGDTIRWKYLAKDVFDATEITSQKVDTLDENLLWFSEFNNSEINVRTTKLGASVTDWNNPVIVVGDELPVLTTIICWHNTLYAVGRGGAFVKSDDGVNWNVLNNTIEFVNILGVQYATKLYEEHLHAIVNDGGVYRFAKTYDGAEWIVGDILPDGFPIRNYSCPISVWAKPSAGNVTSRLYIVGGETANGILTSSTWSCDGTSWAEFPQNFLPAMSRPSIIQYTLDTDNPKTLWILWPGVLADGSVLNTPYFSENKGVTWKLLTNEYSSYSTTSPIAAVGGVSAILNPNNYWMYFIGGVDSGGQQKTDVFGGQLMKLIFDKIK